MDVQVAQCAELLQVRRELLDQGVPELELVDREREVPRQGVNARAEREVLEHHELDLVRRIREELWVERHVRDRVLGQATEAAAAADHATRPHERASGWLGRV